MSRPIARRDFLQGVAIALGGAALAGCRRSADATAADAGAGGGPPDDAASPTGDDPRFAGHTPVQMRLGHTVRAESAPTVPVPAGVRELDERYDLVVVGAGLAGLAAAYTFRRERRGARILMLDAAEEVGGHARRNTFEHAGTTLIGYGGTMELEALDETPDDVAELFGELGISRASVLAHRDEGFLARYGLSAGVFFHPRVDPRAGEGWVRRFGELPWRELFASAPLPEDAQRELVTLFTTRENYLRDEARPRRVLAETTWADFIRTRMGLGPLAVRFADLWATDLLGLGADAVSAAAGMEVGPGFGGMGGERFTPEPYDDEPRFPDGNHTLARCLLRALVPAALPGGSTPEDVFLAPFHPEALDVADNPTRVRLRSMAVRIEHTRPGKPPVAVTYRRANGAVERVTSGAVVMGGWGMVQKRIVPELGDAQRVALGSYRYAAVLYINVLLRHWRPLAALGLFEMQTPAGFASSLKLADPLHVGSYRPRYEPDAPILLTLHKYLHQPGLAPDDQLRQGRALLEATPFAVWEAQIREELTLLFGKHGFDAAADILAITINRWGHGYNIFGLPSAAYPEARPYERGRTRVGRISFAGADAGGSAWSQAALEQGIRAAREQLAG